MHMTWVQRRGGVIAIATGLWACASLGAPWQQIPLPPGSSDVRRIAAGEQTLVLALADSAGVGCGVFQTAFTEVGVWVFLGAAGLSIRTLGLSGVADQHMLAACIGEPNVIYRAAEDTTWAARNNGIEGRNVRTPVAGYPYPGRSYASLAGSHDSVAVSTDFGGMWTIYPLPVGVESFSHMVVRPGAALDCWAVMLNYHWDATPYRTTDGGATWDFVPCPEGLGAQRDLEVFPQGENSFVLIAGYSAGLLFYWSEGVYEGSASQGPGNGFSAIGVEIPAWDPSTVYLAGWVPEGHLAVFRCSNLMGGGWEEVGTGLEGAVCPSPDPWWQNSTRFQFCAARGAPCLYLAERDSGLWTIWLSDVTAVPAAPSTGTDLCSPAIPMVSAGEVRWLALM
jgi:hypothetical protein